MKNKKKEKPKPEDFKTKEEAVKAIEDWYESQPIYNYFQFFIGGRNNAKTNKQQGKPGPPPY
jgi:hypothetical protein